MLALFDCYLRILPLLDFAWAVILTANGILHEIDAEKYNVLLKKMCLFILAPDMIHKNTTTNWRSSISIFVAKIFVKILVLTIYWCAEALRVFFLVFNISKMSFFSFAFCFEVYVIKWTIKHAIEYLPNNLVLFIILKHTIFV